MLEKKPLLVSTYEQQTAVTPRKLVKMGTAANEVVEATDASALIIGVADETASDVAGEEVAVIMMGIAPVTITSAATKGAAITATTGGVGTATTTDNDYCVGYLLETTTASNETASVLVNPFMFGTI